MSLMTLRIWKNNYEHYQKDTGYQFNHSRGYPSDRNSPSISIHDNGICVSNDTGDILRIWFDLRFNFHIFLDN